MHFDGFLGNAGLCKQQVVAAGVIVAAVSLKQPQLAPFNLP
jgi:hypothetical protein